MRYLKSAEEKIREIILKPSRRIYRSPVNDVMSIQIEHEPIRQVTTRASDGYPAERKLNMWAGILRLCGFVAFFGGAGGFIAVLSASSPNGVGDAALIPALAIGLVSAVMWFFLAAVAQSFGELIRLQRKQADRR